MLLIPTDFLKKPPYLNKQFKMEYSTQKQSKLTRTFLFCLDLIWKKGLLNVQWPVI